jgi:hypothetical protein
MFNDLVVQRLNSAGTVIQTIAVPIAYGPKEKWLVRIRQDANLDQSVALQLPRMGFEMTGLAYDGTRRLSATTQNVAFNSPDLKKMKYQYVPVPYNIDVSLYILTKTQEDGLQILEQILPTFTPEYTLSINVVPDMNVKIDVPIVLNSVSVQDDYDGDFQTRRFVTHSLNFQMKMNLFGPISDGGVIQTVNANVGNNEDFSNPNRVYTAEGDVTTATVNSESWLDGF